MHRIVVIAAIFTIGVPAVARAQCVTSPEQARPVISVSDLMPNAAERVARAVSVSYGISDVSDYKVVGGIFEQNPDSSLWKWTATVKGSTLFITAGDYKSVLSALADPKNPFPVTKPPRDPFDCQDNSGDILDRLSRSRARDRVARVLAGFTVSASLGKRAQLDTFGLQPPENADDRTKWTYDLTFDPTSLFRTSVERKSAFEAYLAYLQLFPHHAPRLALEDPCAGREPLSCVRRLSGLSKGRAWLASLIPTVKIESIDEFDYATIGGQPILFPEAMQEGALQTYLFTWDLQKIFKGTEMRTEAIAAYKAYQAVRDLTDKSGATLAVASDIVLTRGSNAIPLTAVVVRGQQRDPATGVTWKRAKDKRWIDGLYVTADGVLVGTPQCSTDCPEFLDFTLTYGTDRIVPARVTIR